MYNTFGKDLSPTAKLKRPTHVYSEEEIARYEEMVGCELEGRMLTFKTNEDKRIYNNWKKTKKGAFYTSRLLIRQEVREEVLKEFGIITRDSGSSSSSSSSSRVNASSDRKRKRSSPSVERSFSTKPMVKENDFDTIMDDTSSLSSNSLSDTDIDYHEQRTTTVISGNSNGSTTEPTESALPSLVLDIKPEDLVFEKSVGEGQVASVLLAKYRNVLVACKSRRENQRRKNYESNVLREVMYSAKLSACRFMNPCIGVVRCKNQKIRSRIQATKAVCQAEDLFLIQRYYENGDLRDYITRRQGTHLHHFEVLQIGLSLFAGLSDAHKLGVGIVDLKLENILVDVVGSAWFTDFGSCVDFRDKQVIELDSIGVKWTEDVAAPEMLRYNQFSMKSDVFMCAVILAEIMTPSLDDEEFARDILGRSKDGSVAFNKENIHPMYRAFTQLLEKALSNEPLDRPTADTIYQWLRDMRRLSMEFACKEVAQRTTIE